MPRPSRDRRARRPPPSRVRTQEEAAAEGLSPDDDRFSAEAVEREDMCAFWFAGEAIAAGQEVCRDMGVVAPDMVSWRGGLPAGWEAGCRALREAGAASGPMPARPLTH
jgi:hypothetical protein